MNTLHLYLLGAPRIEVDGAPVATDRRKAVALLAYLALTCRAHSREALATYFWPDYAPASALAYLRRTLWEINQLIGDGWLDASREQVALRRQPELWIDVAILEQATSRSAGELAEEDRYALLARAAELYRGDFLEGFTLRDSPDFDAWQTVQGEHLRRQVGAALATLAAMAAARGLPDQALAYARRWQTLDPLHGPATALLMRLYADAGQRAAALRQFEQYAASLRTELGATPEPELAALAAQIRRGELSAAAPAAAAPTPAAPTPAAPTPAAPTPAAPTPAAPTLAAPAPAPVRSTLPTPPTPFVGRRRALEEIGRLLHAPGTRLLTLIGPGGSGKTRLALEAARRLAHDHEHMPADGAVFVGLAPLTASSALVPAIAKALDFSFYAQDDKPQQEQLIDFLRGKELLLLLDNLEHLLDDASVATVSALLAAAPRLKLLVTSRTRLNVQSEQLYPVAGMSVPDLAAAAQTGLGDLQITDLAEHYSSLQLFAQAAQRVQPGFALTPANLGDVVQICRRVEGMPLAIELAAAWLEVLTPVEIAAEVARRLDFLESELRDLPERQRSLRAVFESSWRLLGPREQAAYLRLSVFRGGFTRAAAQAVGDVGLPQLLGLVNKSWLQRDGDGRFQVHELLRQFAEERLHGDAAGRQVAQRVHAEYYVALARRLEQTLRGPHQRQALDEIAVEYENLRAVWHWLIEHRRFTELVAALLPCFFLYSQMRGQGAEFAALADDAYVAYLQPPDPAPGAAPDTAPDAVTAAILATASAWYGINHWIHPVPLATLDAAWANAAALPDPLSMGSWYVVLVGLCSARWGLQRSIEHLEATLPQIRTAGGAWQLAHTLVTLGDLHNGAGAPEQAQCLLEEALTLMQAAGDHNGQARTLYNLGVVNRNLEQFTAAVDQLLTARTLLQELGDKTTAAFVTWLLAETTLMMGDFPQAFGYFAEEYAMYSAVGDRLAITFALNYESFQALRYGDLEHARRTRRRYMEICEELGEPIRTAWGHWEWGDILRVEGQYAAALQAYAQAHATFVQVRVPLGEAFYRRGLGDIAFAQGDYARAAEHLAEGLAIAAAIGHGWAQAYLHGRLAQALVRLARLDEAAEHLRAALRYALQYSLRDLVLLALLGCAELLAALGAGRRSQAVAVYVHTHVLTWREFRTQAGALIDRLAADLAPLSAADTDTLRSLTPAAIVARYLSDIIDPAIFDRGVLQMQTAHPRALPVTRLPYAEPLAVDRSSTPGR